MNAYTWGILASIAVYLAVGHWAGRRVRRLEDYFVAGRRAPTLLIVGTLVASLLSTTAFLGEVGMAYSGFGPLLLILVAVNVTGYVSGALLFGRHLRRSRALTVAEFFGQRFASRRVQVAAGVTIIVGLGSYLVAVTQGAALVVTQVSDMPYAWALIMVWAGYTLFTLSAGSRGVIITDTMMFVLFTGVSFLALFFIITAAGGWFGVIEALALFDDKPGIISWHGATRPGATWETAAEGLTWALILGFAWAAVVAVSPWQASRYLMARDEHTVLRAACGASIAIMVFYPVLMLSGAAVNLANTGIEPPERAMLWAALNLMPTAAGTLLLAGIMAAALSSSTTFLSLVGFSASHDLLRQRAADEARRLKISRLAMLGVSLVALALTLAIPPRIFWITYFAGTVFASSWGPVAVMSVWSRRITADAAFWGIVIGFVGNVVPKALDMLGIIDLPVWADPILIGAALGTAAILAVSRRGEVSDAERRFQAGLHAAPADAPGGAQARATARWPLYMVAAGVLLATALLVLWALPYGAARPDGEGWPLGEILLATGWGGVLVLGGLALRWHLGREPRRPAGE